jgi:hypothetical protein
MKPCGRQVVLHKISDLEVRGRCNGSSLKRFSSIHCNSLAGSYIFVVRHLLIVQSKLPPFPSRLRHRLALTRTGRGDGEGGRDNPLVEPELSSVSKAPVD